MLFANLITEFNPYRKSTCAMLPAEKPWRWIRQHKVYLWSNDTFVKKVVDCLRLHLALYSPPATSIYWHTYEYASHKPVHLVYVMYLPKRVSFTGSKWQRMALWHCVNATVGRCFAIGVCEAVNILYSTQIRMKTRFLICSSQVRDSVVHGTA